MKQCINCLSKNIITITEKNRLFYFCQDCNSKSSKIINNNNQIYEEKENRAVKHFTAAALIIKENKILLLNRKRFPFGHSLPTGHLLYNETIEDALERTILNKTGLHIISKKKIFQGTIYDKCRFGGELNELYLFECSTEGEVISVEDQVVLIEKNRLDKINLVNSSKIMFSEIGLFKNFKYNIIEQNKLVKNKISNNSLPNRRTTEEQEREACNLLAYRSSLALCSNSNFSTIAKTILKQMFFSLDITGLSLMTRENNILKVAFRYSKKNNKKRKPRILEIGQGVAGKVAQKKTLLTIIDSSQDPLYIGVPEKNEESILSIPIISNNELSGVLNLTKKKNNYFSEEEIKSAEIVANRIALAIENENLYQEIRRLYKESEQARFQMEKIINNTGDGITVRNAKGEFVVWNNAMKQITGFERAEDYMTNNPEVKIRQAQNQKEAIEKNKNLIHKEIKVKNSEKADLWLGTTYTFIKDEKGNIINTIAVSRDISKEKEIENRQKEFIYTATHELRTPITAIKGYLSMLENGDGGELKDQQKKYLDRALISTDRLVKLVEELLQTAKLEEENVLYDKKSFSGRKLANEVITDLKNKAKAKNLNLSLTKPNENIKFYADYDKTRQAISNILDNSIKYTQKGEIRIGVNSNKKNLGYISIMDTGVGIPKKEQQNIFNKFIRVPNPESIKAGGTGLGLYIVKKIIEQQGGKIEIESELNKGTTFNIYLPIK